MSRSRPREAGLIPYGRQSISEADIAAVAEVLRSDFLTQGPAVAEFERAFSDRHGVAHAVAVCNATAGLHLSCLALGVGRGSMVWTSPNSFLASANCARYCGAEVDFVERAGRAPDDWPWWSIVGGRDNLEAYVGELSVVLAAATRHARAERSAR